MFDNPYWSLIPTYLLRSILTTQEKLIYIAMSSLLNDEGKWKEDPEEMMQATRLDKEDVIDALDLLKRRGKVMLYEDGYFMPYWSYKQQEAERKFHAIQQQRQQ